MMSHMLLKYHFIPTKLQDLLQENNRSVELYIYNADGEDNVLSVGEVQHFTARITLPPGASYADFAVSCTLYF